MNKTDDGIEFKDDDYEYHVYARPNEESYASIYPYVTAYAQNVYMSLTSRSKIIVFCLLCRWNFSNVCFDKISDGSGLFTFK